MIRRCMPFHYFVSQRELSRQLKLRMPLAGALEVGNELGKDAILLINLSGRGDKDVQTAAEYFGMPL
jgi:tryptophan synthase beta subunit